MSSTAWSSRCAISGRSDEARGALEPEADGEQALDDEVVEVPADPVPVLQHRQPLLGLTGLRDPQREGSLPREARGQVRRHRAMDVGVFRRPERESAADPRRRRSPGAPRSRDRPVASRSTTRGRPPARPRRCHGPRPARRSRRRRARPSARATVPQASGPALRPATARTERSSVVDARDDPRDVGVRDLECAVGDRLQGLVAGGRLQQQGGDLRGRLEPGLSSGGLLVEARVLDRHAGRRGQRDRDRLVIGGEVGAVRLLGQVEVAEDTVPDPDAELRGTSAWAGDWPGSRTTPGARRCRAGGAVRGGR